MNAGSVAGVRVWCVCLERGKMISNMNSPLALFPAVSVEPMRALIILWLAAAAAVAPTKSSPPPIMLRSGIIDVSGLAADQSGPRR